MCTKSNAPALAIFDFDGTLLRTDSLLLFLHFAADKRIYRLYPRIIGIILGYKMGRYDAAKGKGMLLNLVIGGMKEDVFNDLCIQFVDILRRHERCDAIAVLRRHQALGHRICIVSASPINWIKTWAKTHEIEEVYGTPLEVKNGLISGALAGTNCRGVEKINQLNKVIPDFATEYETYAYGDSAGDKEMLAIVRHPYYRTFPLPEQIL